MQVGATMHRGNGSRRWRGVVGALVAIPVLFVGAAASHAAPLTASLSAPGSLSIPGSSTCGGQTWVDDPTPEFSASTTSQNPASSNLDLTFRVEQGVAVVAESPLVRVTPRAVASWELPPESALADNQAYSFEVRASQGAGKSAWSAPYTFTEETSAPAAPSVQSFDYPPRYWGAPASQPGTFRFAAGVSAGVAPSYGFVWALDSGGTLPSVGCQSAFDDGGYGLLTPTTGTATLRLPGGLPAGSHDLYVAALSAAGLLSPVTSYQFLVSPDDSVVAQPERYLLEGNRLAAAGSLSQPSGQNACTFTGGAAAIWADGHQEHLVGTGPGQSFTFEFKAPVTASYALGVHLTDGADYGELAFSLVDLTSGTTQPLLANGSSTPYDAYNPTLTTTYVDLGGASLKGGDSYGIAVTVTGKNARTSSNRFPSLCPVDTNPTDNGYSAGIDYFTVVAINDVTFPSLRAALNNRGLVLDATGRVPTKAQSMDLAGGQPVRDTPAGCGVRLRRTGHGRCRATVPSDLHHAVPGQPRRRLRGRHRLGGPDHQPLRHSAGPQPQPPRRCHLRTNSIVGVRRLHARIPRGVVRQPRGAPCTGLAVGSPW